MQMNPNSPLCPGSGGAEMFCINNAQRWGYATSIGNFI